LLKQVHLPGALTQANVFPEAAGKAAEAPKPKRAAAKDDSTIYILVAAAAVGFFIYKKRKAANG
jgi:hypothetical protein